MAITRADALPSIPEILLEYDSSKVDEGCANREPQIGSAEDEGYGSETQRRGIDMMLDSLADMSRRLSFASSGVLGIDEALHTSRQSGTSLEQVSRDEQPDIASGLEAFWRTVRQELSALRDSRNEARADSMVLLEEIYKKASEIEQRDTEIQKLKAELSCERKAGRQLQVAMEGLLAWVDSNRSVKSTVLKAPEKPAHELGVPRPLELDDDIPTYGVAFRSGSANRVTVWNVQVVQCYENETGLPVYFHGRHLPRTVKSYVKFLQFWCSDRLPESTDSAICLWCCERKVRTVWNKGFEAKRPCRECALRGRHCFAVASGTLTCLPNRDIAAFLEGDT